MPPISVSSAFNSRIDDGQYVRMILNSARTARCLRFIQWEMPIQDAIRGNGQEFHHWLDGNLPHRWPSLPVHGYTERDSGRVRTLLGYPTRCIVEQMEFQILLARLNAGDRADQQGMASWRFCRSPPHWVRRLPAPAEERLRPHLARRDLSHTQGSTLCRSRRRADSPARSSRRCNRNNLFRRLS